MAKKTTINPIAPVEAPTFREFNRDLFGVDFAEQGFDMQFSNNDDYQVVEGLANLKQWIYHCLITNPGELFAHPDFGCGLEQHISDPMTPQLVGELTKRIRSQISRDPRIQKVAYVRVRPGDNSNSVNTLFISIGIIPVGDNKVQDLQYAITEQDWAQLS